MEEKKQEKTACENREEQLNWLWAALFAFAGVCAIPYAVKLSGEPLDYTNSLAAVLLFAAFTVFFKKILDYPFERRRFGWFWPGLFGLCFGFCMVFGVQLDRGGSVCFTCISTWTAALTIGVLTGLFLRYFWERWGNRPEKAKKEKADKADFEAMHLQDTDRSHAAAEKKSLAVLKTTGVIWLCYFAVFLAVYPGFFVYDAQDELMQVITRSFSTHHPLIHVLMLGGIIQLFHKLTGSYNIGIACYTIFQMTVMAGIFGYCVRKLKQRGLPGWGQLLLTLYFGLCPVLVMFSLCSAKDGLFMGMLLIMTLLLQELRGDPVQFLHDRRKMAAYGMAALLMMLLRHNGFYAFLVFIPVLAFAVKGQRLRALFYQAMIAVVYLAVSGLLTAALHADTSENQELLTVPISQMARVYVTEKDSLPEEEKEILYRYLPEESLERYTPKVTDGVKIGFNNQAYAKDKGSFIKLWIKWGIENPFTYMNAWLMTSYGFWYPDTVIDVYRGNSVFTFTYEDSSYFGYEVEEPGLRESKIPWLNEWYRKLSLDIFQQRIPVVSMLFSPGFLFWVMAFGAGFLLHKGQALRVIPFVPLFLCFFTVLLGPTSLVRYVVYWWAAVPLLFFEFDN